MQRYRERQRTNLYTHYPPSSCQPVAKIAKNRDNENNDDAEDDDQMNTHTRTSGYRHIVLVFLYTQYLPKAYLCKIHWTRYHQNQDIFCSWKHDANEHIFQNSKKGETKMWRVYRNIEWFVCVDITYRARKRTQRARIRYWTINNVLNICNNRKKARSCEPLRAAFSMRDLDTKRGNLNRFLVPNVEGAWRRKHWIMYSTHTCYVERWSCVQ